MGCKSSKTKSGGDSAADLQACETMGFEDKRQEFENISFAAHGSPKQKSAGKTVQPVMMGKGGSMAATQYCDEDPLNRGLPPTQDCTKAELIAFLKKFKILGTKEALKGDDEEESAFAAFVEKEADTEVEEAPVRPKAALARRRTVAGQSTNVDSALRFIPTTYNKDEYTHKVLTTFLQGHPLFQHMDDREIRTIVLSLEPILAEAGAIVFEAGEIEENPCLFVLYRGAVTAYNPNAGHKYRIREGQIFGDESVVSHHEAREVTCKAQTECMIYALDAIHFRNIITAAAHQKRERYIERLDKIEWLLHLPRQEKMQLADALEAVRFHTGETIIHYKAKGEWMYIIEEGTVDVWGYDPHTQTRNATPICSFGPGDSIGELEFIAEKEELRYCLADCVAVGDVRCLRLQDTHFEMCLGPIKEVLKENAQGDKYKYYQERVKEMEAAQS